MQSDVVRFAAYRRYENLRSNAHRVSAALLVSSRMTTRHLRADGNGPLPPQDGHLLDVTAGELRELLTRGDGHLGTTGVPYVLALHEDHLRTCLTLLERAGRCPPGTAAGVVLANQYGALAAAADGSFDRRTLVYLHLLRMMRNCVIHNGGRADERLVARLNEWKPLAERGWTAVAGRSPRGLQVGDPVGLGQPELAVAGTVTNTLDRAANRMLQQALPREVWADLVVEDFAVERRAELRAPNAVRRVGGLAHHYYRPLGLTRSDLDKALVRFR